uniref:Uncharacterized protein n=1 Tax=Salix viminalis TaxID=40686 RepID=A0A6N2MIB0_SALVM
MEEVVAKEGMIGTTIGPKGTKQLQDKKFEQEAQKLWFRMRNEVIQELQEKGYDFEGMRDQVGNPGISIQGCSKFEY